MGVIAGKNANLQIGLETTWGTAVAPTVQIDFTSEDMKLVQDLKEEDTMTGRKFSGRIDIMGRKTSGSIGLIVHPDNFGLLLGATLGSEATTAAQDNVAEVVEITCPAVSGTISDSYFYISDPTTDFYVWYNLDAGGTDPAIAGRTGIEVAVTTGNTSTQVATATASAINGDAAWGGTSSGAVVTATAAAAGAVATDPSDAGTSGVTFEVITDGYGATAAASTAKKHVFTPVAGGAANSLPALTVVVDRVLAVKGFISQKINQMQLECAKSDYLRGTFSFIGRDEQTDTKESLSASTLKPFAFKNGIVRFNSYLYATVEKFSMTYDNKVEDDRFVMDNSKLQAEVEPQDRECMYSLDVFYDGDTEALRESYYKTGADVDIEIYFQTTDAIETGYYYFLKIESPLCTIMEDPSPVIAGPGRIKMSLNLKAKESSSQEAVTITLGDAQATDYIN